jgi:hypothetical protein
MRCKDSGLGFDQPLQPRYALLSSHGRCRGRLLVPICLGRGFHPKPMSRVFREPRVPVRRFQSKRMVLLPLNTWNERCKGILFAVRITFSAIIQLTQRLALSFLSGPCEWIVSLAPRIGLIVYHSKCGGLSKAYQMIADLIRKSAFTLHDQRCRRPNSKRC